VKRTILTIAVGVASLVWGINGAFSAETVTMGEVVVTASRQEEKTIDVPAHVTVVTAEDIENATAQNLAEILQTHAGVHVSDITGNQRNYNIDLRGFGESAKQNSLLLVDGRRVNLDDISGADWNLVPLDRIARIEVIRGSRGTVLYGDNATAGVINIITKEGGGPVEGTVAAAYGSYDTFNGSAAVSGAGEVLAYDISASYRHSDGYRDNSDGISRDVGANLRFDPSDRLRLHLSAGYHYDDTRNPGDLLQSDLDAGIARTATTSPDDFDQVGDYYVKAGVEGTLLSDHMIKLETSYRNRDKKSFGTFSGGFFEADTTTDIYALSPQLILNHAAATYSNRAIIGADFSKSEQTYDSLSEFFGFPSEIKATLKKENTAVFIHDKLRIGKSLSLSGGYRSDRAVFSYAPATLSEKTLDEEGYSAGVNYAFTANSHVYGSYTRSFRYPVLDEQFTYFTSTVDPNLEAQTTDNIEIGASTGISSGLVAAINLFRADTDNEIAYNPISFANENLEGTTIRQGAEFSLSLKRQSFSLSGTYTRTATEFDGGPYDGKEVPFVPNDRATAKASYAFGGGLRLGLEAVYTGESFLISDFENSFDKAAAYTVVNAKLQYDWRGYSFFADLNNVFNEAYSAYSAVGFNPTTFVSEPGFYPSPKLNVLVGVTARFGPS
jgi:iron complex outermembrane receptor protein